ncbi:MAG: flippase-like domain-containing protein [Lentisphaerae bacterium]|nr:flippase-like domain-containing protein [Lentisphaerota bacterium]
MLNLLKLLVSAGLIWALYRQVPLAEFRAHAAAFRPAPMAIVLVLLLLNTLLSSWKWQILLRADGVAVPLSKLFASYLIGTFCNLFLPSSIGGDAYRVYDIARYSSRGASSFASVLADRLSGFLALVALALVAAVPVALRARNAALLALPLLAAAAIVTALVCLSRRAPARLLLKLTRLERVPRVTGLVERVIDCFQRYQREPAVVARIMAIAFVFQLSVIVCVRLLAACLDIHAAFRYFAAFVPLISLMEAAPISIYGIGVRDAGYAFFFGFAGLTPVQTRALALLYLITNVLYSLLGGVVFLFAKRNPPQR